MSQIRRKGLFLTLCALTIAGCSTPRDPFANQATERAEEQCLSAAEFARLGGMSGMQSNMVTNNAAFINGHPMQYVVKKGDTLWDISGRFLRKPWYWRQIWYNNPQIKNPHWIYPGDVLSVVTISGQKYLSITEARNAYHGNDTGRRTADGRPVVRMDPNLTDPNLPGTASAIAQSILGPFLVKTRIAEVDELQRLPFIFGNGNQYLTLSQQEYIYTKGVQAERGTPLWVYRPGAPVIDFDAERKKSRQEKYDGPTILGQQMDYVGEVTVLGFDPASGLTKLQPMKVNQTMQEGDVLMLPEEGLETVSYFPQLPSKQCQRGYILNNTENQSLNIKEYDTVVTSFGVSDGAQVGDVWAIERPGQLRVVNGQPVAIPGEKIGFLMIYKVYNDVSLGVVLDSTRPISNTDYLVHP